VDPIVSRRLCLYHCFWDSNGLGMEIAEGAAPCPKRHASYGSQIDRSLDNLGGLVTVSGDVDPVIAAR